MSKQKTATLGARITEAQRDKLNRIIQLNEREGTGINISDIISESLEDYFRKNILNPNDELHRWNLSNEVNTISFYVPKSMKFNSKDAIKLSNQELLNLASKNYNDESKHNIILMLSSATRAIAEAKEQQDELERNEREEWIRIQENSRVMIDYDKYRKVMDDKENAIKQVDKLETRDK